MKKSIKTLLKSAAKDYVARSVNPPVVRASTILFKTMQELRKHQRDIAKGKDVAYWDYGRQGTQTTVQLQKLLRGLEDAHQVFLTPTGFSAVALAIMSICRPGDEIVISDGVYRPTQKLADDLLKEFNVKAIWYNPNNFVDLKNNLWHKESKDSKKSLVHKNVVVEGEVHDLLSVGLGARHKLTSRISVNAEYFLQLNKAESINPLSVGVDIETGGHVFQLHLSNSAAMFERAFIHETNGNWLEGDIYFGFNISRVFTLEK